MNAFSQRLLRAGGGAETEAADGRDPRGRRRVRPAAPPTAPARSSRSRASSVIYDQSYPPPHHRFHAGGARGRRPPMPTSSISRAYPPDNVGIVRAANEIGLNPKMFGGAMIGMLVTPIKVQLGPIANGLVDRRKLRAVAEVQVSRPRRPDQALSGEGAELEDRSARLCLRAVRLCGRTDARPGGHRDQEPRPRQARRLHPQPQASRPWPARSRSARTANGRTRQIC